MNTSLSAPLLFNWEPPRERKGAIIAFLAGSLMAHALCFYVFQVVYPPTVALLPPPTRLSVIAPDSEEGRTLLRWIEAEDPALAFATQRPPEARLHALPKVRYVPFYLARDTALKELPPMATDVREPSSQAPGAVPIFHRPRAPMTGTIPTTISFSNELNALGTPSLPPPRFSGSTGESPENMQFRIAVGPRGDIRYCFRVNSSGDPRLDEQIRLYLTRCHFPARAVSDQTTASPASSEGNTVLTWGVAIIEWGNDVSRPTAAAAITSTP